MLLLPACFNKFLKAEHESFELLLQSAMSMQMGGLKGHTKCMGSTGNWIVTILRKHGSSQKRHRFLLQGLLENAVTINKGVDSKQSELQGSSLKMQDNLMRAREHCRHMH
jgi:hypothetical protein